MTEQDWVHIADRRPEVGQKVWYYFHHKLFGFTICSRGEYDFYEEDDVSRWPDTNEPVEGSTYPKADGTTGVCDGTEPTDAMKFACDVFGNDSGWLTNDVTHWMPDVGQEKPEPPHGY